jgi:hypothetical protein
VKTTRWLKQLTVTGGRTGVVSHAGVALIRALTDNLGLTAGLSAALAGDLWVAKSVPPVQMSSGRRRLGRVSGTWLAGPSWRRRACDDRRLAGLRLIFLIVTRAVSLLGLSRHESWWKNAEILMLRHQLAVAEREHPRAHSRLTWPDRAWLALLAGTLPIGRLAVMRLIVTPARSCAGTATSSAAGGRAGRAREGPAGPRRAATSGRWC